MAESQTTTRIPKRVLQVSAERPQRRPLSHGLTGFRRRVWVQRERVQTTETEIIPLRSCA